MNKLITQTDLHTIVGAWVIYTCTLYLITSYEQKKTNKYIQNFILLYGTFMTCMISMRNGIDSPRLGRILMRVQGIIFVSFTYLYFLKQSVQK